MGECNICGRHSEHRNVHQSWCLRVNPNIKKPVFGDDILLASGCANGWQAALDLAEQRIKEGK